MYWTTAGSRVFNVFVDSSLVLAKFDPFLAGGGKLRAAQATFTARFLTCKACTCLNKLSPESKLYPTLTLYHNCIS